MGEKGLYIFRPEKPRMGFCTKISDIPKHPLTIGLFRALNIATISKDLSDLVHDLEILIWAELRFIFHLIP